VVWITERGRALAAEDGSVERLVGVSRDVSAQRRAERERERLLVSERLARDEAERQSRIKDEFLATLSHELRTPMNAILGWISMLARGEVRKADQAIAAIQRNASIQAKLIEDLLEMNKLTSGTVRLELEPVDLVASVDGAMQALKPMADTKGVTVSAAMTRPIPKIHADERRVQQILWNLVHNAVKFTPASGRVEIGVVCDGVGVEVCVRDTGQGISADFLPFVFDRFRQADSSTTRGSWGLGIGLSIVRHLVELHGGSIQAGSDGLGTGATFVVRLPVHVPVPADASQPVAQATGRDVSPGAA
jgi:signal transduction histidine kinase